MARQAAQPPQIPGLHAERLLGSGGFSDVFLYRQELPERQVAVKVLALDEVTDESRAAFVAEANLMAQLSAHPYIVTIYNAAVAADGRPYFVMEYCPGPSLSQQYRYRQFSVVDVLRTGIRVTSAVATAHSAGILHRDIKPANVLTNAYGWPALADFGISSVLDPDHAGGAADAGNQALGMSIPWSPPEMFAEHPTADVRSDVFSLAATVYTLLAGRSPFEVPGAPNGSIDLIGRIERGTIMALDRQDVPASLLTVLRRGMSTRRDDRFPSAIDFGRSLQRVELELGYSPTTLDVPNLAPARPRENSADEDATRMRPVTTIAPSGPQAPTDDDDATRVRSRMPVIEPTGDTDATRVRPRPITPDAPPAQETGRTVRRVSTPVPPAPPQQAEQSEAAPAPRRRMLPWAIALAAVIVVGGGVTASVLLTGDDDPTPAETSTGEPLEVAGVPSPVEKGKKVTSDGTSITFKWSNPDPQEGDLYVWQRTDGEQPGPKNQTDEPSATVDGIDEGAKVCVSVVIRRADGKMSSEPLEMCSS